MSIFRGWVLPAVLAVIGVSHSAWAVPEATYARDMAAKVMPFFESGQTGSFKGEKGFSLRYRKWENSAEKGAIVLLPGRGDPYQIYAETIYDFAQNGYSVYALDHRGQGSSDRLLKDPQLGYVDKFDNYVKDLQTFMDQVVNQRPHSHRFLVAHSMGGAVGARYLHDHPGAFTSAALVSPMLKINTSPYTFEEAPYVAFLLILAGRSKDYAPNRHAFDPTETFTADNSMSTSQVRWQNYHDTFVDNPELQVGGATVHWAWEALAADRQIQKEAAETRTPILMLIESDERIVTVDGQTSFCSRAPNCVQPPIYKTSEHLILQEKDEIRNDALKRIFDFFATKDSGEAAGS
jgi:lysophospholipase